MTGDTQGDMTKYWRESLINSPLEVWKKMMTPNAMNGMAKSWMLPSSITGCDLSISMKNPLQAIKPLLAFNLKQQKTFIEVSSLWMNYLTTLAKNHREAYTNGGNGKTVLNGAFDASKDLFKSYTSFWMVILKLLSGCVSPPVQLKSTRIEHMASSYNSGSGWKKDSIIHCLIWEGTKLGMSKQITKY